MSDGIAARRVVDIITGTWRAQALHAATELDLPEHVAQGPATAAELAERSGASRDGVARLMRLLAAMEVFTGPDADGRYGPTEVSELLRSGAAESMRDMVGLYGREFHRAWGAVVPAVRTGTSGFEHAFGATLHQYLRDEPGAGPRFQAAMNAGNVFFADVLDAFDFGPCRTVVDVAGGSGMLLASVLRAHPDVHGVLFDLPHMLPVADAYLKEHAGPGRYETVSGDVFSQVPPDADAYLLSRVLQDWDDARCTALLLAIRKAMSGSARLLILERVVPGTPAPADGPLLPLLWDLHLLMAAGGRERTLDGYRDVLSAAGLRLESVHGLALETTLLVAAPV